MDWTNVKQGLPEQILSSAEGYLRAQLHLATSADQRAATMASIFAASGAAILGGLLVVLAGSQVSNGPIIVGGLLTAALFLTGAAFCIFATLPADFYLAGNEPDSWKEEVETGVDHALAIRGEIANCQDKINKNDASLIANGKKFKAGAIIGIVAPVVGFAGWLAMTVISSSCSLP